MSLFARAPESSCHPCFASLLQVTESKKEHLLVIWRYLESSLRKTPRDAVESQRSQAVAALLSRWAVIKMHPQEGHHTLRASLTLEQLRILVCIHILVDTAYFCRLCKCFLQNPLAFEAREVRETLLQRLYSKRSVMLSVSHGFSLARSFPDRRCVTLCQPVIAWAGVFRLIYESRPKPPKQKFRPNANVKIRPYMFMHFSVVSASS